MVKWFKIYDTQYIGFWVLGLVLFLIQEIPYIIMPLFKLETNPIMNMRESSAVLNVCEKVLGSLCIAFMTFIVSNEKTIFSLNSPGEILFFCIATGIILLNFFGWFLYFSGHQSLFVMLFFIVALPPLYYVFISLWRNNIILTITGCLFLVVHFIHTFNNLKLK